LLVLAATTDIERLRALLGENERVGISPPDRATMTLSRELCRVENRFLISVIWGGSSCEGYPGEELKTAAARSQPHERGRDLTAQAQGGERFRQREQVES